MMKRQPSIALLVVCFLSIGGLFLTFGPLSAVGGVVLTVNSTVDAVDAMPGNGVCETVHGNGICTLRAAVQETNALPGADTIQLPEGTYTLALAGVDNMAAVGDLDILDDLSIVGGGADQTIVDGAALDRVIHVVCVTNGYLGPEVGGGGFCAAGDIKVAISNLTIRNGLADAQPAGAGIFNDSGILILDQVTVAENRATHSGNGQGGGGITNFGVLSVTNSLIISNTTVKFGGGIGLGSAPDGYRLARAYISESRIEGNSAWLGGGIDVNSGDRLIIEHSVIAGNTSSSSGGGISYWSPNLLGIYESEITNNVSGNRGGGISGVGGGAIDIQSSTINGNQAFFDGGGASFFSNNVMLTNITISNNSASGQGGGLFIDTAASAQINNSTIYQNSAGVGGGGIHLNSVVSSAVFVNSIVAGNSGVDCGSNPVTSEGHNLESGTSCNFIMPGDLQNSDPLLGILQNNGGWTSTHALLAGSPAADAGDDGVCLTLPVNGLDQRGYFRIDQDGNQDGGQDSNPCDIGAYEISNMMPTSVQLAGEPQGNVGRGPFIALVWIGLAVLLLIGFGLIRRRVQRVFDD